MKQNYSSSEPCVHCGLVDPQRVCLHHIFTRKARPDLANEKWNLVSVCQEAHNLWHMKGTSYMAARYPNVSLWLANNGWYICGIKRWWHDGANAETEEDDA